jgi:hypothetical protein
MNGEDHRAAWQSETAILVSKQVSNMDGCSTEDSESIFTSNTKRELEDDSHEAGEHVHAAHGEGPKMSMSWNLHFVIRSMIGHV